MKQNSIIPWLSNSKFWLLICVVVTLVVMSPNINNGWVNWDDELFIIDNPLVDTPSVEHAKKVFTTLENNGAYTPMVVMSWSIDYAFDGHNPKVFHITNVLLHLINVSLVFIFIYSLSGKLNLAIITTLLFGVHPMQLEAVAWITSRKDLMYGLFYLLGLIAYTKYLQKLSNGSRKFLLLSLVFFLFSLFSKGMAVTFPLAIILLDVMNKRKVNGAMLLEKVPFLALSLAFGILAISGQEQVGAVDEVQSASFIDKMGVASYSLTQYFAKALVPIKLSPFHPYPYLPGQSQPWYMLASIIPAMVITLGGGLLFKRNRMLGGGILFFLISMVLVLQFFPVGIAIVAERFSYLGYVGLFFSLAIVFRSLIERFGQYKSILTSVGVGYVLLLGGITFNRAQVWKDSESLWSEVINKYPDDFIAFANRADHYKKMGKYDLAFQDYEEALQHNPAAVQIYMDRGEILLNSGDLDRALLDFEQVIHYAPEYSGGYTNRGLIYMNAGQPQLAMDDFNKSIELEPTNPLSFFNRGVLHQSLGNHNQAVSDLTNALNQTGSGEPVYSYMNYELGLAHLSTGNLSMAKTAFEETLVLNKNHEDALTNLGLVHLNLKEYQQALQYLNRAVAVNGGNYSIFMNRALAYHFLGRMEEALFDLDQCLAINPNAGEVFYWRSLCYQKNGQMDLALQNAQKAMELKYPIENSYLESLTK